MNRNLFKYGDEKESDIEANIKANPETFDYYVDVPGPLLTIKLNENYLIYTVKHLIQQLRPNSPIYGQTLSYQGKQLECDTMTLADYGVPKGSTLFLMLGMKGD